MTIQFSPFTIHHSPLTIHDSRLTKESHGDKIVAGLM